MAADLKLKTKQGFWETPRKVAIIMGTTVAVISTIVGVLSYQAGQKSQPAQILQLPPSTTITISPAKP